MPPRRNAASNPESAPVDWRALLGTKVSLRYRLHDDARHPFSEAVGMVASVEGEGNDQIATIVSRRGRATQVPTGDVLVLKHL